MVKINIPVPPLTNHYIRNYVAFSYYNVESKKVDFFLIGRDGSGIGKDFIIDIENSDSFIVYEGDTIEEFFSINQIKYKNLVMYTSSQDFDLIVNPA